MRSRSLPGLKREPGVLLPSLEVQAAAVRKIGVGRPRSEEAHLAILEAAYELLSKAAARDISVSQIAEEAGVSTATLYRWWPTKEAVLVDAFIAKRVEYFPNSVGDPLDTLAEDILRNSKVFEAKHARVALRLLAAVYEDVTLKQLLLERLFGQRMDHQLRALTKAIQQGQLPPDTDGQLFLDLVFGMLLIRLVVGHAPINSQVIKDAFNVVVAGVRNVNRGPPKRA